MTDTRDLKILEDDIRRIYDADGAAAEIPIRRRLEDAWKGLSPDERLAYLDRLILRFGGQAAIHENAPLSGGAGFTQAVSLILGERVSPDIGASSDLLHRLAESLNVVFDALNQLVGLINRTLYGSGDSGTATIRHVIGSHIQGDDPEKMSLEAYILQIKKAFLDSQKACQGAVRTKIGEILDELDPSRIAETAKGLKFGPFQKAELFKIYEERYDKCRKWYDSDRFQPDFLREFEKNCHKLSKHKEA